MGWWSKDIPIVPQVKVQYANGGDGYIDLNDIDTLDNSIPFRKGRMRNPNQDF